MQRNPLQYESLKSILTYLEPNFRFHLARRLPSIRIAEKSTPLKLDFLHFHENTIILNKTQYQVSLYRQYHTENPPLEVSGPVPYDLDEFGFQVFTDNNVLPGDVQIKNQIEVPDFDSENQQGQLQRFLEFSQHHLRVGRVGEEILHRIEKMIVEYGQQLLPFDYRQNQKKSPCELCVQLAVSSGNKSKEAVYRMPYTVKIYPAMKHLIKVLFGNRRDFWEVKKMSLDTSLLRWPEYGILPVVRNLEIGDIESTNLKSLKSIVHPLSFPLESFECKMSAAYTDGLNKQIITGAKILKIKDSGISGRSWLPLLTKLQNSIVHFNVSWNHPNILNGLVSNWLERGRPIGTCYTFSFSSLEPNEQLNEIKRRPEVLESSQRLVKLSMKHSAGLIVSYDYVADVKENRKYNWILEMKVVHREQLVDESYLDFFNLCFR